MSPPLTVTLLIFCCLLYQFVNISPVFPQVSSPSSQQGSRVGVYAQLARAVERQDWVQALRLVDLLREHTEDPAQRRDLENYRLELESDRFCLSGGSAADPTATLPAVFAQALCRRISRHQPLRP
jgi:hypothetical protein